MAVAVSLGATSFDFTGLIREQQRLSKQLLSPVARNAADKTQNLKFEKGGIAFDTYIKVLEPNSADPQAKPTYQLFYRDNTNTEHPITGLNSGEKLGGQSVTAGLVAPNNAVDFDLDTGEIRIMDKTATPNTVYAKPGAIQFEAASGLTLASVNRRLADINSAIEAMSRVMQVANGATEGVQGLLR